MTVRRFSLILAVLLAVSLGLTARVSVAPARAEPGDSVVLDWNQRALDAIAVTMTGPTIAARALAVVHTAIYDAWAAYDPVAVDSRGRLRANPELRQPAAERTLDNKNKAVSFAAYVALVDLFSTQQSAFDRQLTTVLGYATDDTSPAAEVGAAAARAVLDYRHHDGANQLADEQGTPIPPDGSKPKPYSDYTGYRSATNWNDPVDKTTIDHWQPLCVLTDAGVKNGMPRTPPAGNNCEAPNYKIQTYLTPQWDHVKPFALTRPDQFRAPGPYTYLGADGKPSGQFVGQIDKMTQYSKQLDDFRKTTAEYWEDGPGTVTPPGHWNVFAQWVARRDTNTLDEDARMFFALNNGLLDASISAWDGKRSWDSVRPITAIRWMYQGKIIQAWGGPYKGPSYIKGEDWIPYRPATDPAPPFAEYASGHSTFSGAAAEVLTGFTGWGNFEMTVPIAAGSSDVEPGAVPAKPITLKWTNFRYAAEQAGLSRQYGGVHFEHGDKDAREAGSRVGKNAWAKALTYFNGTATPTP